MSHRLSLSAYNELKSKKCLLSLICRQFLAPYGFSFEVKSLYIVKFRATVTALEGSDSCLSTNPASDIIRPIEIVNKTHNKEIQTVLFLPWVILITERLSCTLGCRHNLNYFQQDLFVSSQRIYVKYCTLSKCIIKVLHNYEEEVLN